MKHKLLTLVTLLTVSCYPTTATNTPASQPFRPSYTFRKLASSVVELTNAHGSVSGTIVKLDKITSVGYILTCAHFFDEKLDPIEFNSITVIHNTSKYKGSSAPAFIDRKHDLALVVFDYDPRDNLTAAKVATLEPQLFDLILSFGSPLNLRHQVSIGFLSDKETEKDMEDLGEFWTITGLNILPGNSGSAVFNENGEVVGVVTMLYFKDFFPKNPFGTPQALTDIGYCIPYKHIINFLKSWKLVSF